MLALGGGLQYPDCDVCKCPPPYLLLRFSPDISKRASSHLASPPACTCDPFGTFGFSLLFETPLPSVAFPQPPADPSPSSGPLRDPDSVVLCLLAIDEEEEDDIALQIHFTLIQSFCCDNDINIVRVSGMQRLAQLLGEPAETQGTTEPRDLHCLLVTNPHTDAWKSHGLVEVASYCEESRGNNQWVPYISLQER